MCFSLGNLKMQVWQKSKIWIHLWQNLDNTSIKMYRSKKKKKMQDWTIIQLPIYFSFITIQLNFHLIKTVNNIK